MTKDFLSDKDIPAIVTGAAVGLLIGGTFIERGQRPRPTKPIITPLHPLQDVTAPTITHSTGIGYKVGDYHSTGLLDSGAARFSHKSENSKAH